MLGQQSAGSTGGHGRGIAKCPWPPSFPHYREIVPGVTTSSKSRGPYSGTARFRGVTSSGVPACVSWLGHLRWFALGDPVQTCGLAGDPGPRQLPEAAPCAPSCELATLWPGFLPSPPTRTSARLTCVSAHSPALPRRLPVSSPP